MRSVARQVQLLRSSRGRQVGPAKNVQLYTKTYRGRYSLAPAVLQPRGTAKTLNVLAVCATTRLQRNIDGTGEWYKMAAHIKFDMSSNALTALLSGLVWHVSAESLSHPVS